MDKTKLKKHLEDLGEQTSGGAHDAITFSGKGLGFLRDLFKGAKHKNVEDEETEEDDDDLIECPECGEECDEDCNFCPNCGCDLEDAEGKEEKSKKGKKTKKHDMANMKKSKNAANGGELDEENEEDLEDPGQEGDEEIITNKNKRIKKDSLKSAVKKNTRTFDERRFVKNIDEFEEEHVDVLDASPALQELSKNVRYLAKNTNVQIQEIADQNILLAKAVRELLKSNAAMAADLELIKKQPATSPATGYVVLNKQAGSSKARKLRKSEIEDVVTDAMNDGLVEPMALAKLGTLRTQDELQSFVESLPDEVQERL
ncbi:zinc ribbon domain-containing protein [Fodinisporobacter ferrooxydans]|uniref:Zinc ribbon domain-containing protein n=1 Tax=Fodinisporobacter ferrooxydans TaxID=2901836 RepID=A0ABY4CMN6_9BACL|nr:zinc ribbon domain-containing protein [Alicyclobacillaceae bacterium MYW30-H2]